MAIRSFLFLPRAAASFAASAFAAGWVLAALTLGLSSHAGQPPVSVEADPAGGSAVASDHKAATDAAWAALEAGGTAVDAAIAGALTLSVAMPHAASLAGGGTALRYDADARQIIAYIGREIAPASMDPSWLKPVDGAAARPLEGGRAFGLPTLLPMLEQMHGDAGVLPWSLLAKDAEMLARTGVPLPEAAAKALKRIYLVRRGGAETLFLDHNDEPYPAGTLIRNRELAAVLDAIGRDGPNVLSGGVVGDAIVRTVTRSRADPAVLTLEELGAAKPAIAAPACIALSRAALCAPPAPTFGPTILQATALFDRMTRGRGKSSRSSVTAFDWANLMAQSHRLAITDARRYLTDPAQFPDMTPALLTPQRIARRARLIRPDRNPGRPGASRIRGAPKGLTSPRDRQLNPPSVGIVVVDGKGHAVALTITLSRSFGAGLAARGIVLNAANANFDPPHARAGYLVANSPAPGKRPVLFTAPVMALDQSRRLILAATASGLNAPAYLAKTVTAAISFGKSAAAAVAAPNVASPTRATTLEARTPAERMEKALKDIGHRVNTRTLTSNILLVSRFTGDADGKSGSRFDAAADRRGIGTARRRDRPKQRPKPKSMLQEQAKTTNLRSPPS